MSVSLVLIGDCVETWLMAFGLKTKLTAKPSAAKVAKIAVVSRKVAQQPVMHLSPDDLMLFSDIGVSERDLIEQCNGQFSLGYSYSLSEAKAADNFLCWGNYGFRQDSFAFHQLWAKARLMASVGAYHDYCFAALCAASGKFVHPQNDNRSVLSQLQHSIVVDADRLKAHLRERCVATGVAFIRESGALSVGCEEEGLVSVCDESGSQIEADLYLDFTGDLFSTLKSAQESLLQPYNSTLTLRLPEPRPKPYSSLTMNEYGWLRCDYLGDEKVVRQIFNRRQFGEGLVESYLENQYPAAGTLAGVESTETAHRAAWQGNVVLCGSRAVGDNYFINGVCQTLHRQMHTLLELLPRPDMDSRELALVRTEYNDFSKTLAERLAELNWLHADTSSADASIRDSVRQLTSLFQIRGSVMSLSESLLNDEGWAKLFIALGLFPEDYDPLLDKVPFEPVLQKMATGRSALINAASQLPSLQLYRDHYVRK